MTNHWIGVDLGGTKLLAGIFDDQFRLLARSKQNVEVKEGPEGVFRQIEASIDDLFKQTGVDRGTVRGLGMGIRGQVDQRVGQVRYAPDMEWRAVDIARVYSAS